MNIKNPRVHALAREASARTGLTQTSVIEQALERLLADLKADTSGQRGRVERVLAQIDARMTPHARAAILADDLYGDDGLPA